MMISLTNAGKRFNREWIFRHLDYEFTPGKSYAITGPNGSGKSTLLQAIAGAIVLSEGTVQYTRADHPPQPADSIPGEFQYRHVSLAAPYLELVEEMTATEFLHFHQRFKPFIPDSSIPDIIRAVGLEKAAHKQIRYYSSGMKQRLKLAQAIFSDTGCLLLDEPCTNLDADGISLYLHLMSAYGRNRLIIVSSNDETEYGFCLFRISISDYKK